MELSKRTGKVLLAAILLGLSGQVLAGGLVELEGVFDDDSRDLTNPWLPLPEGSQLVYVAETDDECEVSVLDVLPPVGLVTTEVKGVKVRTLWDREFIEDGECPDDLTELMSGDPVESTFDWYAQDVDSNIWYFGEHSVATDHEECDHETDGVDPILGLEGCLDGSWEAGKDIWTGDDDENVMEGIIMLANPKKGQFYFQEFWEDEAEDMGKIVNLKTVHSDYLGKLTGCLVIKEWVPLSPGSIEQKYFCYGVGLVQVKGLSGGKTEWTQLVEITP